MEIKFLCGYLDSCIEKLGFQKNGFFKEKETAN